MTTCTPLLEHDYIGLTEVASAPPMASSSSSKPTPTPPLDIKETELRLGLPGSSFLEKRALHPLPPPGLSAFGLGSHEGGGDTFLGISLNPGRNPTSGAKRGFFDAIDGCYAKGEGGGGGSPRGGVGGVVSSPGCASVAVRNEGVATRDEESELEKKKEEDQVIEHGSAAPAAKAQVVGWPPIRSFRKNTMASALAKSSEEVEGKSGAAGCLYVKVSMDGAPYLRKVNLKNYKTYAELLAALEHMFSCFKIESGNCVSNDLVGGEISSERQLADLLNGSEFVLTYEDKDGDWMLVGDVPWRMFAESCRRLRIMKGSDAIGLAPRSGEKCKKGD